MSHPSTLPDDALAALAHRARQALPDAPPALVRAAVDLWQQHGIQPAGQALAGALRRLVAVLRFDSWAQAPQALGMRGQADDGGRHLLFSAEGRDVDLRIVPERDGLWRLAGQVLGPDLQGRIALQQVEGGSQRRAALDDLGGFELPGVTAGAWRLWLEVPDAVVELPPIDVGASRGR